MTAIVVFSRDPGPTQRLIELLDVLDSCEPPSTPPDLLALRTELRPALGTIRIFARPPADYLWTKSGRCPALWDGQADDAAIEVLRRHAASMVLTGTSNVDEPSDRMFWRAARLVGIPSHVVLDQRINLRRRFMDHDGRVTYPDWIYVPDEDYKEMLARAAVPRHQIRIIGDVHRTCVLRRFAAVDRVAIATIRDRWGVPASRKVVLFVSECGREMRNRGAVPDYDELDQLQILITKMETGVVPSAGAVKPQETTIVIRPHPRDEVDKYSTFVGVRESQLMVLVGTVGEAEEALAAADLVVGMNSSLLHDASKLGLKAFSLTGHPLGDQAGAAC
jgi:hypothetical protein